MLHTQGQTEFTVSEISTKIKNLLESDIGTVNIKGEISGLKIAASGHGYFSLKDNSAVLAATCWRPILAKVNFKLEEGLEIIVTGKITAYPGQSKYQISVESIRPSGIGAFMQILNKMRKDFQDEGLFDARYKQKIPFFPKKIGIVTSTSGVVIKDIIHRIADRCPTHLIIWPVTVQGETSAQEIKEAIDGFNKLRDEDKPDVLIVARGGGSIEDLWSFNQEIVVRAVFNSTIPIISAVGHESDYTLIDLAADVRAPTPTAAAEFAVPVITGLKYNLNSLYSRMQSRLFDLLRYYSQKVTISNNILSNTHNVIDNRIQRLDELHFRLLKIIPDMLRQKTALLQYFPTERLKPIKTLKYKYLQYKNYSDNLLNRGHKILDAFEHRLNLNASLLAGLDYNKVLNRGFAIVRGKDNKVLSSISDINRNNANIILQMKDGTIRFGK